MKYKLNYHKTFPEMGDLIIMKLVAHPQNDNIIALYGEKESECDQIENILLFIETGAFKVVHRVFNDNNKNLFIETKNGSTFEILRTIPNKNLEIREI